MAAPASDGAPPGRPVGRWPGAGRIDTVEGVARLLGTVNTAAGRRENTAGTVAPVLGRADDATPEASGFLPVVAELAEVLPWRGLRRGATVGAVGGGSLLLTLLAGAMAEGAWAAVVGLPTLNPLAADEYGIELSRLALIPDPGQQWSAVVAALVDGLEIVVVNPAAPVPERTARTLAARVRHRGGVLLATGAWPGADLTIEVVERSWEGLGQGRGRLRTQTVTVTARGRGAAARPRTTRFALPPPSLAARIAGRAAPADGAVPGVAVPGAAAASTAIA